MILVSVQKEKKERDVEKPQLSCAKRLITKENVSRIIDGEGHSDKVLGRNEECFVGNWGKGNSCY